MSNIPSALSLMNTVSYIGVEPIVSLTSIIRYLKQDRVIIAWNKERLMLDRNGNLIVTDLNGNYPKRLKSLKLTSWFLVEKGFNCINWRDRPTVNVLYLTNQGDSHAKHTK